MRLHKEGWGTLTVILLLLAAIEYSIIMLIPAPEWVYWALGILALIFFGFCVYFFRNPNIAVQVEKGVILAPADGKVVVIEPTEEPEILKDQRMQISIFMSPLNVHVNRSPAEAEVKEVKYHQGKYLVAWHPKSSTENERTSILMQVKDGPEILLRQIAGSVARRIRWYIKPGDQLAQGQEFGFIKFGSRVDIFLPLDAEIVAKIGQKSKAGRTVLAKVYK